MSRLSFLHHKHSWFFATAIGVLLIFLVFRPLNSPQYRIIVADGLGYYVYLPAQFIYHDTELKFEWFDAVFEKHYDNHLFAKPSQNFMVAYGDRQINLYYPGQSLLQAPFFFIAHALAGVFDYPADGFSLPYQVAMGLSALFYTLLGIYFCYLLIYHISQHKTLSVLIPLLVFFGTNLFTYSIFAGCYTHCYSFCFLSMSLFFSQQFFHSDTNKLRHVLLLLFSSLVVISLRPVNALLLMSCLYFFKPFSLRQLFKNSSTIFLICALLLLNVMVIAYSVKIMYTQTHSFFANTYTIGRFYWNDLSHIADNVIGFQQGILWYTPLIMICFLTVLFVFKKPKIIFLLVPILGMILLYSFWFYWNIVNRTLVDFSGILVLLVWILVDGIKHKPLAHKWVWTLLILSVPFYQLKAYQLRKGILNANYTYWKYYLNYFFTLHHVDVFPVDPANILNDQVQFFDFESDDSAPTQTETVFEGKKALAITSAVEYACSHTFTLPSFLNEKGFKKVKASFWIYRGRDMNNLHLVFSFSKKDSVVSYNPFYINASSVSERWELKEFGMDLLDGLDSSSTLSVYFWNPDKKDVAYLDNVKLEFILKNGRDEINWE